MNHLVTITHFVIVNLFNITAFEINSKTKIENALISNDTSTENLQNIDTQYVQRKWISQLFNEARMIFQMDSNVKVKCKSDYDLYESHLRNQSLWAVKMMDSSEWPIFGIISGSVDFMGSYDECLSISSNNIEGKYCLAEAMYDYPDMLQNKIVSEPDESISAWDVITMYGKNPARVNRKNLKFAICIPSSCRSFDLKRSLHKALNPIFKTNGIDITVDVKSIHCRTKRDNFHPREYYIVGSLFVLFFSFVICSSLYDTATSTEVEMKHNSISEPNGGLIKNVSKIFSITRNFKKLKKLDSKDHAALHFLKILNIMFITYGHRCIYTIGYPMSNAVVAERYYTGPMLELTHVNSIVDIFLLISGFLTLYLEFPSMSKDGSLFIMLSSILLRWIRTIPVFIVLMLYIIYIMPYTGEGPIWKYKVMSEANKCKESLWAILFAVNNIVKTDQQCLISSWYLSVDIQLAIIGGILLCIFSKNRQMGIYMTIFVFITSIFITFAVAYVNNFHGLTTFYVENMKDLRLDKEFAEFYDATYARCGPYLMGFLIAYLVKLLKKREFKFTNTQMYVFLLVSIAISETNQWYGRSFYKFDRQYSRFENALYAASSRVISLFFYAVLICIYFTSGLGIFTKLFEWKIWIPFGRLTYSVFLINTIIQLYHSSSQKEPMAIPSLLNVVWWFMGDAIWCYLIGSILHIFVEAPILNIKTLIKIRLRKICRDFETRKFIEDRNSRMKVNEMNHEDKEE